MYMHTFTLHTHTYSHQLYLMCLMEIVWADQEEVKSGSLPQICSPLSPPTQSDQLWEQAFPYLHQLPSVKEPRALYSQKVTVPSEAFQWISQKCLF